jgi:hypothetical protein
MATLEFNTRTNSKIGRSFSVTKLDSTHDKKSSEIVVHQNFDMVGYLKSAKEYVLGHAAFTK